MEPTPRYVRKPLYPAPSVRPRRVIYEQPIEEPIVVRKKVIRRERTPTEEVIIQRTSALRPKKYYYVDNEGQMLHQNGAPPPEPPRRYVVQPAHPPPARTVRVVRRQVLTPPPPASERWYSGPRRQINSDTEIIQRQQRIKRNETYYPSPTPSPIQPELYHIESVPTYDRRTPSNSSMYTSRNNITPPPKVVYQGDRPRKQNQVQPLQQPHPNPPEPTVVRRVYKKLPPGKHDPPNDAFVPNENDLRLGRKPVKTGPPRKQYNSPPQLTPELTTNPTIYYLKSADGFE